MKKLLTTLITLLVFVAIPSTARAQTTAPCQTDQPCVQAVELDANHYHFVGVATTKQINAGGRTPQIPTNPMAYVFCANGTDVWNFQVGAWKKTGKIGSNWLVEAQEEPGGYFVPSGYVCDVNFVYYTYSGKTYITNYIAQTEFTT